MARVRRRTLLGVLTSAAVGGPYLLTSGSAPAAGAGGGEPALAAAAADAYPSNTALYADPALAEGVDYARRYRRHPALDDDLGQNAPFPSAVVIAPHGGGIEVGTSELCLAIAGYHPATLAVTPAGGPVRDYWMFEGLRASGNGELHVTSTHCDDPYARSLCAGARYAVSLHGCTPADAGLPDGTAAVAVGGRDTTLKGYLLQEYARVGVRALDARDLAAINGDEPENIANRTLTGAGAQLELTTPLRTAMFGTNTRAQRKNTTLPVFWDFVAATRVALARRTG
ncbi:poly-gamma-glutamate hydrolase family protein [Micromonospora sp. NPDC049559]|uniref:poly-gamma-glutamate hydrolase family protein n=1 Tax=Micromonospora sp. NPDC049559 TaxID=3155923 RepID=UPI0034276938